MKLAAAVAALAAGATIASASPLRVIVVSNAIQKPDTEPFLAHMRFGHAASHVNNPNADVAQLLGPPRATPAAQHRKGPCMGALIRQKALEAQNAFRKAFGLPLIDHDHPQAHPAFGVMHFVPPPGTNGGATFVNVKGSDATGWWGTTKGGDKVHIETESKPIALTPFRVGIPPRPPHHEHHHNHPHAHMVHHAHGGPSFMNRLEEALMALGPWEGRAVAFVIGAGIGVLIRMLWVFGVLIFRGCSNDGKEYEAVPEDDDEEDDDMRRTPLTAPPTYVYPIDEKVGFEHVEVPKAQPGN